MPYVDAEAIEAARQIDLLNYLQAYEPGELVRVSGSTYCTREHDSLKIFNGKWHYSRPAGDGKDTDDPEYHCQCCPEWKDRGSCFQQQFRNT